MQEKGKKIPLMVTIISILFSSLATIFSVKTSAKVTNYTETTTNVTAWLVAYAQVASGQIIMENWAKENGVDINSIKNQDIVSFEKSMSP